MKLNKLYKLGQFIDLIDKKIIAEGEERFATSRLDEIRDYNIFLKQPFIKEMFINPFERPLKYERFLKYGSFGTLSGSELDHCQKYMDAEKKVIFKGCYLDSDYRGGNMIEVGGNYKLMIDAFGFHLYRRGISGLEYLAEIKTNHDLAEATNGELDLKNITL
jgi:hypothetical protein